MRRWSQTADIKSKASPDGPVTHAAELSVREFGSSRLESSGDSTAPKLSPLVSK